MQLLSQKTADLRFDAAYVLFGLGHEDSTERLQNHKRKEQQIKPVLKHPSCRVPSLAQRQKPASVQPMVEDKQHQHSGAGLIHL